MWIPQDVDYQQMNYMYTLVKKEVADEEKYHEEQAQIRARNRRR